MLIGITGGSGAGKTAFINQLRSKFTADQLALISMDNYYHPREMQQVDALGVANFDLPESIDNAAFISDLQKLKQNKEVRRAEYTFNNELADAKEVVIKPAPVYIVEGLFILHDPAVRNLLDLIMLIDASDVKKLSRRIIRDQKERNYPLDDVLYRYQNHVTPSFQKYIAPYRDHIDVIINNEHQFQRSIDLVAGFIRDFIRN